MQNTGIILHKNWEIISVRKHESGGLIGAEIKNSNTTLLVMSAYLPTALDGLGMPESFDSTKETDATLKQEEAHAIYSTAIDWTHSKENWILGGDLNETIETWDRKKLSDQTYSYHGTGAKFIQNFLDELGVFGEQSIHTKKKIPELDIPASTIKDDQAQDRLLSDI